jgi:hypothetical protein
MWTGGLIIILTLIILLITGTIIEHIKCQDLMNFRGKELFMQEPDSTESIAEIPEMEIIRCIGIENDIHTGYLVLAIGAAMIVGGYITRKGEKNG